MSDILEFLKQEESRILSLLFDIEEKKIVLKKVQSAILAITRRSSTKNHSKKIYRSKGNKELKNRIPDLILKVILEDPLTSIEIQEGIQQLFSEDIAITRISVYLSRLKQEGLLAQFPDRKCGLSSWAKRENAA